MRLASSSCLQLRRLQGGSQVVTRYRASLEPIPIVPTLGVILTRVDRDSLRSPLRLVRSVSLPLRSTGTPSLAVLPSLRCSRPGGWGGLKKKCALLRAKAPTDPLFHPPLAGPRQNSDLSVWGHRIYPLGDPPKGAPGGAPRGGPRGGPPGRGPPPPARGPPGPPGAGPDLGPKKAHFRALSTTVIYGFGGVWGAQNRGVRGPPGGPGVHIFLGI